MRRVTATLSVAAIVLVAAGAGAQTKPSFAGEWKKVAEGRGQGEPGMDLVITHDASSMTVEDRRGAPVPVKLTYKLDGSPSKNVMPGDEGGAATEQVSKATWAGTTLVVTTTTAAGEEKRTFSMEGGNLVVQTSATARGVSAAKISKVTYKRYERGHGG